MAEGLVNYTRLDDPLHRVATTQGRPISLDDEILIVDDEDCPVAPGEIGHLLTRGPYTIRGYYRAEAHNARAFTPEGHYRTGDLVRLTADGYLVVEGRAKDQINRGGEKVPAEEVEQLLMTHPHVMDVALVAMPDRHLGEKSCAFVIRRDSALRAADLTRFVREAGVAAFKVPDRVEFVDNFPKTPVGKIDKKVLRQRTGHLTQRIDLTPHQKVLVAAELQIAPDELRNDDSLLDWGLDSVRTMSFVERWRSHLPQLQFVQLAQAPTLTAWWNLLRTRKVVNDAAAAA